MATIKLADPSLLRTEALIDGAWVKAASGETFDVQNPADGSVVAAVAKCGQPQTREAIDAANNALALWRDTTAKHRSDLLLNWYKLILENRDDLALILTTEMGKPLDEARGEITYGANYVRWFSEEAKRVYGDTIPAPAVDIRVMVIRQPIGVVACITPWNFPNAMLARKIAPALAAGNTVVCKPANLTPLSALALGELANRAGIPAGVINILAGQTSEIGEELTSNPIVRKLTFTGSTGVGKMLMEQSAKTMKRISMELGGNAPFIVFDDADLNAAVEGAMACKFRNAGQTCVCANRLFVQDGVYDEFMAQFKRATDALVLGDGRDDGVDIGPMVDAKAADGVRHILKEATSKGAHVVTGGGNVGDLGETYVSPTILTDVTPDMRVFTDEIFGPIAPVFRFSSEDEVIKLANDTEVGLAAYFYSRDIGRVFRVGEALEYGMVGINTGAISNEMAPFGGVKESGQGREGSRYGLDDYTVLKSLTLGGIT